MYFHFPLFLQQNISKENAASNQGASEKKTILDTAGSKLVIKPNISVQQSFEVLSPSSKSCPVLSVEEKGVLSIFLC